MGLFDFLFKDRPKEPTKGTSSFRMLDGYVPKFTSWGGGGHHQRSLFGDVKLMH